LSRHIHLINSENSITIEKEPTRAGRWHKNVRALFGWTGLALRRPAPRGRRRDLPDQAFTRLEVAVSERGDDVDEHLHRVATNGQRVGVRVTSTGERREVRLGQALDQSWVDDDTGRDDVGLLPGGARPVHAAVCGRNGLDASRRDGEHSSLNPSRGCSYLLF